MSASNTAFQNRVIYWSRHEYPDSSPEKLIVHRLKSFFEVLAKCPDSRALLKSSEASEAIKPLGDVLDDVEYGFYAEKIPDKRRFYRAVYLNLSGEVEFPHLLETLLNHPTLGRADFYFLLNSDIGLKRTNNVNLARSLAMEMAYNYVYAPCYLRLDQPPHEKNQYGLQGHAILTRHPVSEFQILPLVSQSDPLRWTGKRIGCQKAIFLRTATPGGEVNLLTFGLDAVGSPRQRNEQLRSILSHYEKSPEKFPLLVAGDWQTTVYNTRNAARLFLSFLNKIIRGFDYIAEEHHCHPESYFERRIFSYLESLGLDYHTVNQMGIPTWHCRFEDFQLKDGVSTHVARAMIRLIRRFFYHGPEQISLKTDWFAVSPHIVQSDLPQAERPKVFPNHFSGGTVITKHHPMVLDFELRQGR